jgi:hypothetical protein
MFRLVMLSISSQPSNFVSVLKDSALCSSSARDLFKQLFAFWNQTFIEQSLEGASLGFAQVGTQMTSKVSPNKKHKPASCLRTKLRCRAELLNFLIAPFATPESMQMMMRCPRTPPWMSHFTKPNTA